MLQREKKKLAGLLVRIQRASIFGGLIPIMTLTIIGIALNLAGVWILFYFGLPSKYDPKGPSNNMLWRPPTKEETDDVKRINNFVKTMAYVGLILLIYGSIFQLFGLFY